MAESEINVVSRLRLDRDSWASDLQGARSQMTEFVQGLAQQRINVPLAIDLTEAAARINAFRLEQESRPIRIPVEMVPAGGGGGGAFNGGGSLKAAYSQYLTAARTATMPGPEPYEVNEFSGGGAFGVAPTAYNSRVPLRPAFGAMTDAERNANFAAELEGQWANRYVPSIADIQSAEEGPLVADDEEGATGMAGRRGGGGMRDLRLFMAAHFAIRGAEAAYTSAEQRWGSYDNQSNSPEKNAQAAIRQIQQMRAGMGGLTGVARDAGSWMLGNSGFANFLRAGIDPGEISAFGDRTGLSRFVGFKSSDYDDQAAIRGIEKATELDLKSQEQSRIQFRATDMARNLDRRLGDAQETLSIAAQPQGIGKRLAEIHKMTKEMADGFDKEAHLLEEAAQKLNGTNPARQKLLDRAQAARDTGASIAAGTERLESDAARHEDFLERQSRRGSIEAGITGMRLGNEAIADELRGDTIGASRARNEARRQAAVQQATNAYHESRGRITEADYGRTVEQIDRQADLENQRAERNEAVRNLRLSNAVTESGDISPYARRRDSILGRIAEEKLAHPGHDAQYDAIGGNEMASLNRTHAQEIRSMRDSADAMNLRAQGRVREANNRELASQEQTELENNADDPEAQAAVRLKFQARRNVMNMPHYSQTDSRAVYMDAVKAALMSGYTSQMNAALKANPGMGMPGGAGVPPAGQGGLGAGLGGHGLAGDKFSQAVDKLYDITNGAIQLYVAGGTGTA